jgi:hypothetical protein
MQLRDEIPRRCARLLGLLGGHLDEQNSSGFNPRLESEAPVIRAPGLSAVLVNREQRLLDLQLSLTFRQATVRGWRQREEN